MLVNVVKSADKLRHSLLKIKRNRIPSQESVCVAPFHITGPVVKSLVKVRFSCRRLYSQLLLENRDAGTMVVKSRVTMGLQIEASSVCNGCELRIHPVPVI